MPEASWNPSEPSTSGRLPNKADKSPLRVLIVDDHAAVRRGIRLLLSSLATASVCGEAANGVEAIQRAGELRPDLVLMDISMPRLDGIRAARAIKHLLPETRVIFVSQNDPEIVHQQATEADADGFVSKSELEEKLLPGIAGLFAQAESGTSSRAISISAPPLAPSREVSPNSSTPSASMLRNHRERLELMAHATEVGFWFCDLPFDKLVWDDRTKEHFWYPPEAEITIEMFYKHLHPEDRARTRETIENSIGNNQSYDIEYRTVGDDGRSRWIRAIGSPFYDEDGHAIRFDGLTIDVTAKRQAEAAAGLLAAIVASSDDAIISKDLKGTITSWNKGAERLFGYKPEEAIGQPITLVIPRDRLSEENEIMRRIRKGERVDHFETIRRRKDGTTVELSLKISPILDRDGVVVGASKVARDITERKRAERALHASEERERKITSDALAANAKFRAVFEQTTVFAGIMTKDGILIEANRLSVEACGFGPEEVLGLPFAETPWWKNLPESQEKIRAATARCASGIPYREIIYYSWADGTKRLVDFALHPIVDDHGEVLYLHPTGVDITDVKLVEENYRKLLETLDAEVRARTVELEDRNADILKQSEQVRELSRRLLRAQDEEQRRVARELHDSAGQTLTVLGMSVSRLAQHVAQGDHGLASEAVMVQDLVQQLNREIRTASYLLHPPMLDENGLAPALSWYVHGLSERSGLEINLDIAPDFGRLPGEMELVVFRLIQECLTNIHRHSGSSTASIRIVGSDDMITVEVRDQGRGITPDRLADIQAGASGVGIRGMRERLRYLRGRLNIESNNSGTVVLVNIPLASPDQARENPATESVLPAP